MRFTARLGGRIVLIAILVFGGLVSVSGPAFGLPLCAYSMFRAGDDSNDTNADGVRSQIHIPLSSSVTGYNGGAGIASAADIVLYDPNGPGFVQFGWYVGQLNSDTPYSATPRLWSGESVGTNDELLQTYDVVGWDDMHAYKIIRNYAGAGSIDFYFAGSYVASADYHHPYVSDALFVGEVNWQHTQMYANAWNGFDSPSTLEDHIGSTWYQFVDHRYGQPNYGFYSTADGGRATDFSYGGGPAYCHT